MLIHMLYMMRLVSMRACFFITGEYVTHMKFRVDPGNFIVLTYIGHSDLQFTYYGLMQVGYTLGGSGCRICHSASKESKCTLTGSHCPILNNGGLIRLH